VSEGRACFVCVHACGFMCMLVRVCLCTCLRQMGSGCKIWRHGVYQAWLTRTEGKHYGQGAQGWSAHQLIHALTTSACSLAHPPAPTVLAARCVEEVLLVGVARDEPVDGHLLVLRCVDVRTARREGVPLYLVALRRAPPLAAASWREVSNPTRCTGLRAAGHRPWGRALHACTSTRFRCRSAEGRGRARRCFFAAPVAALCPPGRCGGSAPWPAGRSGGSSRSRR